MRALTDLTIYRSINALAETVKGLNKTELITSTLPGAPLITSRSRPPMGRFVKHQTAHGACRDLPPAEFEANYYRSNTGPDRTVQTQDQIVPFKHRTRSVA